MIELRNISKSYGSQLVFSDLNLTFEKGEICILLGPSGCGKSTLLKLINRLLTPDCGDIFIEGTNIQHYPQDDLRRNMGYAIQGVGLFPHMNVHDNIAIVPSLLKWNKKTIDLRVDELLDLVGLPRSYQKKFPFQLSGGEAQRVGVARALAADPDILLMDEPFGALDLVNRFHLQQEFLKIQKKLHKTVIFVTHDIGEAVRMADKLIIMNEGKVVAMGDPLSIVGKAESVARAFLGNSYTLELLEKQTVRSHATKLQRKTDTNHLYEIDLDTTFKDVLALMLMNGTSLIEFESNNETYCIDFDSMLEAFRGSVI